MDAPIYERFDTNEGFQAAIERLLEQPGRELRVFDPDGAALQAERPGAHRARSSASCSRAARAGSTSWCTTPITSRASARA